MTSYAMLCAIGKRQNQRIAAGQHDLPDTGSGCDVIQCRAQIILRKMARFPHGFAAKAKAAVDKARQRHPQDHTVGITVGQTGRWRMNHVPNRIGKTRTAAIWLQNQLRLTQGLALTFGARATICAL